MGRDPDGSLVTTYRAEIVIAAGKHNLDPDLVQAVMEQESSYRFYAYRFEAALSTRLAQQPLYRDRDPAEVAASYGLMQVLFTTAVQYGFSGRGWQLFDPELSLHYGCLVLARCFDWANHQYREGLESGRAAYVRRKALAAYNGGLGGSMSDAAQGYAIAVLDRWDRIRKAQP